MDEFVDDTDDETNPREFEGEVEATSGMHTAREQIQGLREHNTGRSERTERTSVFDVWRDEEILDGCYLAPDLDTIATEDGRT